MTTLQQIDDGQTYAEVAINENTQTLSHVGIFGKRHPVTTALTWGYYGGIYGGAVIANGTVTLTNTATNYVVLARATGVVSTSTSNTNWNNNTDYGRLYLLTTAGGVVTAEADHRFDGIIKSAPGVGGVGDVVGPASSIDGRLALFDGITGTLIKQGNAPPTGTNTGDQTITLTGDVTGSGTGSFTATLATVNSNVGAFGSATQAGIFTVNAKGLVTAASQSTVTPAVGSITGLGTNVATFLATPSSANLAAALTDETGTGLAVFATSPVLTTPNLGVPSAVDLTNATKFKVTHGMACSDETTALTAGTAKLTFRVPAGMTVAAVRASLTTAQTSGSIFTVDINEGGTTILSTKLTIDNTEKTSTTAATAAVISDATLADDAEITIDIDQVGDGTAKGLKVWLIGRET